MSACTINAELTPSLFSRWMVDEPQRPARRMAREFAVAHHTEPAPAVEGAREQEDVERWDGLS